MSKINFDTKTFTLAANASYRLMVAGSFFKIVAASGKVKVQAEWGTWDGMGVGQGLANEPYSFLNFTDRSGGSNAITIVHGEGDVIDSATQVVTVAQNKQPQSSLHVNVLATVTSGGGVLLAANANRQSLQVQNQSTTGNIWISYVNPAVVGSGIKVTPGNYWEPPGATPTGAIYAIGDIASNPNIVTAEG